MIIELQRGDITKLQVDVIVNAANSSLMGGGGVDGAIHKAGGSQILEECMLIRNKQGGCKVGEAVITNAGLLKAKKVIHTVGPKWNSGNFNEAEKLQSCYINSLELAETNRLKSIAFPNISTGIYGYPKYNAATIAVAAVKNFQPQSIEKIIFICFDEENHQFYKELLNE